MTVQVGVQMLASVKTGITLRAGMRFCARMTHFVPGQNGLAMKGSSTLFTHMLPLLLMGLHVDSEVVLILEQSIAHNTLMTLGAFGLQVFVTLVSFLKHMMAVGARTILK